MSKIRLSFSIISCYLISSLVYAEENPLTRFLKNAEFELNSYATGYFQKVDSEKADNDDVAFSTRLTARSKTKLTDSISLGMELYANYSSQKQEYYGVLMSPGSHARQARILDFNSAWLRYQGNNFELMGGKDFLVTGITEIYSPADIFGRFNVVNPSQYYRIGVWQAGIKYFIDDDTLSFRILPVAERNLIPSQYSRWLGSTNDPQFAALGGTYQIEEKFRPVSIGNMGYLLQYKGTHAGYDFYGLLYHGSSFYPTLDYGGFPNQRIKKEPLATVMSVGVMKVIDEWKFYGESIYQVADSNQDEDFIRYSVGITYSDSKLANILGFNQINTTIQWSGDETVNPANLLQVAVTSREARPFRNTVLAKIEIEHNNKWGYFFTAIDNVEGNYALATGAQYKPTDNLSLRLEGGFFDGPSDTIFGRWQNNNFLRLHSIYKF